MCYEIYTYFIYNVALHTPINPIGLTNRVLQLILQTVIHESQECIIALRFAGILCTFGIIMLVILRRIAFGLRRESEKCYRKFPQLMLK